MSKYNFITWNLKGMGNLTKRKKVLSYLNDKKIDIAFLQETHLLPLAHEQLQRGWVGKVFYSSFTSNSRGVAILVHKKVSFIPEVIKQDINGRYIFVKGLMDRKEIVFMNCYCPNFDDPDFINELTFMLMNYRTPIFWGGDFNCILDPKLDRSSQKAHSLSNMSLALLNNTQDMGLHEIWRTYHPIEKDFSFYSYVHNSYSRIDFFFIPTAFVSNVGMPVPTLNNF